MLKKLFAGTLLVCAIAVSPAIAQTQAPSLAQKVRSAHHMGAMMHHHRHKMMHHMMRHRHMMTRHHHMMTHGKNSGIAPMTAPSTPSK